MEDELRAKYGEVDQAIAGHEEFFAAMGRITFLWAGIESSLDICIAYIHRDLHGSAIDPVPPYALKRKISYLRKAARTIPALAKGKDAWLAVLARVQRESRNRHSIVHSFAVTGMQDGTMGMVRLIRVCDKLESEEFYRSVETMEKIVTNTVTLANACLWMSGLFLDGHSKVGVRHVELEA
jgi:hypothetical protein